jgi:nitroreductase
MSHTTTIEALEAIRLRRSTRKFRKDKIPDPVIEKLIDAGRMAPTARNEQPWEFIVVTQPERLARLGELADYGKFIAEAPACVAVFCRDTKYYLEDGCAATTTILLAATALEVGSCWVAGDKKPYAADVAKLLGVPPGHKLVSLIALGYSAQSLQPMPKRDIASVLHRERF